MCVHDPTPDQHPRASRPLGTQHSPSGSQAGRVPLTNLSAHPFRASTPRLGPPSRFDFRLAERVLEEGTRAPEPNFLEPVGGMGDLLFLQPLQVLRGR